MSLSIRQWLADHNIQLAQLWTPGAHTTGIAFRLVQDMQVKSLSTFDICPFAEVLELPWGAAWPQMEPIAQLTVEMVRILTRKKPLRRNEGTWLAFQIAYLRALHKIVEQEYTFRRPWLDRAGISTTAPGDRGSKPGLSDPQLQGLLKTLRPGRLSDTQAEQALGLLGESFLVQQMNQVAIAWLAANGAEEIEAKLIVQRLLNGFPGYLLAAIAENALPLVQLQKFVRLGNTGSKEVVNRAALINQSLMEPENLELSSAETELAPLTAGSSTPNPIDLFREQYRATLLQDLNIPILEEFFALKDIHVPLKGQEASNEPVTDQQSQKRALPVDLMEWATNQLADLETVAVIEAPPGTGKTSFCQMWAAKVAWELYPSWMPISIRLRDATLGRTLEQTLDSAFPAAKFTHVDGWLSPLHPPCLLILDGLDELPHAPQTERHLSTFLEQVKQFLLQRTTSSGRPRHKIVLTCRSGTLVGNSSSTPLQPRSLPLQFRRITIPSLDQEQLKLWFKQWSKVQSKSIAQGFFNFLKQAGVFHFRIDVRELATFVHQPLMLLLLAVLYRDGRIDDSILPLPGLQVRFEIYDRLCRWLLGEPPDGMLNTEKMPMPVREGLSHACRSPEAIANLLQGHSPAEVRYQMQVAALAILQSPHQSCTMATIEQKLALPQEQRGRGTRDAGRISQLPVSSLPPFYFRTFSESPSTIVEFTHSSLGEYLSAFAIAQQLKALTQQVQDAYGEVNFAIDSAADVAQHLYNLLSFGVLSPEIEELLIECLRREEARDRTSFSFEVLFDRLYRFYRSYCRGRWIDQGIAHATRSQLATHHSLNALHIDAFVGLNVFLLLCACHREAMVPFWPCGDPAIPDEFNPDQLLTLIGRTTVLSPIAFWQRAKSSLSQLDLAGACLHHVMFADANFWKTNFFTAELVGANLTQANLQETNLSWANLTGANLAGANLSAAKLEGANLTGANLMGATIQLASLTNACLFQAQMDEETKDFALKNGALFSPQQYQACQQALAGLEMSRNTRVDDSQDGDPTLLLIERANGSIAPSTESDLDAMNEETVFLE